MQNANNQWFIRGIDTTNINTIGGCFCWVDFAIFQGKTSNSKKKLGAFLYLILQYFQGKA